MSPPIDIDGSEIQNATIDGQNVNQVTIDGQEVFDGIPDSGDLHARYDATKLSLSDGDPVTTLSDETGNGHDLTANSSAPQYVENALNGNPVVRFDGVNDNLDVPFSNLAQPNHIFIVAQLQSSSPGGTVFDGETDGERNQFAARSEFQMFAGGSGAGVIFGSSSTDTSPHVFGALYNTSNSELRKDGAVDISGSLQPQDLGGFTVGSDRRGNDLLQVDVGEILIYPQDKSNVVTDVESFLSDKWGIPI